METDRNVAEYMQIRNLLIRNWARILAAQLLLVAVFFCGYLFLQNTDRFTISLHNSRILVKSTLIIISLLIALCATMVMNHARKLFRTIPDEIGIRSSREIISEAYGVAKGALGYNMTLAGLIAAGGIFASLMLYVALGGSESAIYFSRALFLAFMAAAVLVFLPSFDRMQVYRMMLSEKSTGFASKSIIFEGTLAGIMMPLSVAVYLFWRYFGNNRAIAWITFPAALLVCGIAFVLANSERNRNLID